MTELWSPERVVSETLAAHLIESQFPLLTPVQCVKWGQGWDNTVFLVNDHFIFRFPRRAIAVQLLQTEKMLLPSLVPELPLAIPEPIYYGYPSESYPWPFIGYKLLEGEMPGRLSMHQRMQSVESLALFLRKLHQYPVDQAQILGVPPDHFDRLCISKKKVKLEENIYRLVTDGIWEEDGRLREVLASLEHVKPDGKEMLTHRDLHMRNLLVNDQGILSGIIDWGDAHIGHPAIDLSVIYFFLPPQGRNRFVEIYGELDEETRALARFKAIYSMVWLLRYASDEQDQKLIAATKEGLHLALMEDV